MSVVNVSDGVNTGCSGSHATHEEMQYTFYFFYIYYNKCWKCPPLRSSQRCTRRIMLANTFCNVPVDILSTVRWMLVWSSCSVCVDDLNTQYPWDAPIKSSLGGLSPGIVEATISLKWGVQETQIPSKPWVEWLFEHPVVRSVEILFNNVFIFMSNVGIHYKTVYLKISARFKNFVSVNISFTFWYT
jgi:hypothetical protein